jgi:hypothetical protein
MQWIGFVATAKFLAALATLRQFPALRAGRIVLVIALGTHAVEIDHPGRTAGERGKQPTARRPAGDGTDQGVEAVSVHERP